MKGERKLLYYLPLELLSLKPNNEIKRARAAIKIEQAELGKKQLESMMAPSCVHCPNKQILFSTETDHLAVTSYRTSAKCNKPSNVKCLAMIEVERISPEAPQIQCETKTVEIREELPGGYGNW